MLTPHETSRNQPVWRQTDYSPATREGCNTIDVIAKWSDCLTRSLLKNSRKWGS